MRLVITEKKDQASKLAAPFPHKERDGYYEIIPCQTFPQGGFIAWTSGHLVELSNLENYNAKYEDWRFEDLPIIPETFQFAVIKEKKKIFDHIKALIHNDRVSEIVLGTDPTREGSLIGYNILNLAGNTKPVTRLWVKSLTRAAVKKAFNELLPEESKIDLYYEADARKKADWLVGVNLSRAYSLKMQEKKYTGELFSIGRIHTTLLGLIEKREEEQENFVSTSYWEVYADFDIGGQTYRGKWYTGNRDKIDNQNKAHTLAAYCREKKAKVERVERHQVEKHPPLLYNLSSIQIEANKRYQYSPKQTDDALQSLYLGEFITYPRTESNYISVHDAETLPEILEQIGRLDPYIGLCPTPVKSIATNKRYVNAEEVSGHCALLPTEKIPDLQSLPEDERNIYDLIVRSVIAAHYESFVYEEITIHTYIDERFSFKTVRNITIREGWKSVYKNEVIEKNHTDQVDLSFPAVTEHQIGTVILTESKEDKTTAPPRYTEGDLITLLNGVDRSIHDEEPIKMMNQTNGLGTEENRSGIIQALKSRKYIEVKSNLVYPTKLGRFIIQVLRDTPLTSVEIAAKWEQQLSDIGKGKASVSQFLENLKKWTRSLVKECEAMVSRLPENQWNQDDTGRISERKSAIGNERSKKQSKAKPASEEKSRPHVGQHQVTRNSVATRVSSDTPLVYLGKCPECATGQIVDRGNFYGCLCYSDGCRFTLNKIISGVEITADIMIELLETGQTPLISGFKKRGKENETFDAVLTLKNGKLEWKFPNWNAIKLPTRLLLPDESNKELSPQQQKQIKDLETVCYTLKLPAKVKNVVNGPIITRYELAPESMDINVKKFGTYKANLQMALQAERIAMQIPIPGTRHIGIEVPSPTPYVVNLRSLLEHKEYLAKKESLSFPVGTDLHGKPVFANLAEMPHLLIAGTTGSGKSVCLNSIIISLLYGNTPDDLKFVFIDPKRVELIAYQNLPHLMLPVITDMRYAGRALQSVIKEMEGRYELFKDLRVNNIAAYNSKIMLEEPDYPKMPYIVLVIDEFASLMLTASDHIMEDMVIRLSQEARAAGIHLILATQRPVAKVFNPTIKANLPTRISFMVTSTSESMVVLDEPGAEGLLGRGDMYFKYNNIKKRLVSPFVSGPEINRVVSYILKKYGSAYESTMHH